MNWKILDKSARIIASVNTVFIRGIYKKINWQSRLIWIVWQRWVGKTTLILQYLQKENIKDSIYFSADNINIIDTWLYSFVEKLYLENEIEVFCIDEIHKYKNWNQELKNIYDDFPKIQVIFSWSSSLDLIKWKYDLSRRVLLYTMKWLSFQEYLALSFPEKTTTEFSLSEILENPKEIIDPIYNDFWDSILAKFSEYIRTGYYPFSFESEDKTEFYSKLFGVIDKLIYEDIANFYSLDTLNLEKIKKIIIFFSLAKPWELSINSLKNKLWISFDTAARYLQILNDVWIVRSLYIEWNISKSIRKADKLFIDNSNLIYTISEELWRHVETWTIREVFFVNQFSKNLFYSDIWDFSYIYKWEEYIFEIGWKNKKRKQVQWYTNAFIVSDSIIFPSPWKIPLWLFGFMER